MSRRILIGIDPHTKRVPKKLLPSARYSVGVDEVGRAARRRASPNRKLLVGIDEVGRGCLAGPVTVAAVAIPQGFRVQGIGSGKKLRDSKKLTAKQREEWFEYIENHPKVFYARANVYPRTIDHINISQAANLAATRALKRLLGSRVKGLGSKVKVILDGGLYLKKTRYPKPYTLIARTIVKGDEKYAAIKLASIIAKVNRDRIISRNHRDHPVYGLAQHKGYGTRQHIRAIKKHGPCDIHRLTFLKNFI